MQAQEDAADTGDGFHEFESKEGKTIEGRILEVSKDWVKMRIVNRSNAEFEFEVNKLALDDQQFVKDWIKKQPVKSDFEIEVTFSKATSSPDRERTDFYTLETRETGFEITLKNKSTETLVAPSVEYILIFQDNIHIYQSTADSEWTYSESSSYAKGESAIYGESTISDLEYNRDQVVKTNAATLHKAMGDGNVPLGEDELEGVLVRLSTSQGVQVGVYASSESKVGGYTWEQALNLAKGETPRRAVAAAVGNREAFTITENVDVGTTIDVANRPIHISAKVSPSGKGEGVIAALGGGRVGLSLYVKDRKIYFVQTARREEATVSADLPLGEFTVDASLGAEKLTLTINGRNPVEADSFGLFTQLTDEGFEIGEDRGSDRTTIAGSYGTPFPFAGTVRETVLTLEADAAPADDE